MEHLEPPERELWESRREWFEGFIFKYEERGSHFVGEQASALISDVQCCFCAGAWISVIVLTFTVIEANLSEITPSSHKTRAVDLLKLYGLDARFDQLRRRRNKLVHATGNAPAVTIDDQWGKRETLEFEAKNAVQLMFEAFYLDVGT